MKVIINGRKYDTETARLLGEVMNENASIGCPVLTICTGKRRVSFSDTCGGSFMAVKLSL